MIEPEVRVITWNYKTILYLVGLGLLLLVLQTTIGLWAGPSGHGPEFLVVMVVFLGLKAPLARGAILSAGFGFLRDATSGGIFGMCAALFFVIFLATHRARQRLDPTAPYYLALFIFLATLGVGGLSVLMLHMFGWAPQSFSFSYYGPAASLLMSSLLTMILGLPLYWICKWLASQPEEQPEQEK